MKIAILGAGWLGASLGESFLQKGYTVFGSKTSKERAAQLADIGIKPFVINLDLTDPLPSAFFEADMLILTLPPGRRDPNVLQHYPKRIEKALAAAQEGPIKNIIYTSSTSVYGNVEGRVTEQHDLQPVTNSGKAVVEAEQMLKNQSIPVSIVRFGGLVGGNRQAGRFFAGKQNVPNGNAPVNFVHRDDCIGAIEHIIEKEAWNEVFNICATEHPLKKDFYPAQAQKLGFPAPTFTEEKTQAYKIVSNEKIRKELGYIFKHPDPMLF